MSTKPAPTKTKTEIRAKIAELKRSYRHVLDTPCATVFENAPRALMQVEARNLIRSLCWVLGEPTPKFKCDSLPKQKEAKNHG